MNQSLWLLFLLFSVDTFCTASTRIRGSTQRIYDPKTMTPMSFKLECLTANDMTPSEGVVWKRASGDGLPGTANTSNPLTLSDLQLFRDNPHSFEDQYTCTYGGITSNPVSVYVLPKPTRQDDIEQTATVGERETIECPLLFGNLRTNYTVSWTENGHTITSGSEGYLIRRDPNDSLIISDVTPEHMANYQCTASLSGLHPMSSPVVQLMPYQAPKILNIGPADPVVVADGTTALVTCNVSGFPKPEVEWCVNETCSPDWHGEMRYSVIPPPNDEGSTYLSTLQISPVREEDSGNIACRVTSNNSTVMSTTELFVPYRIGIRQVFLSTSDDKVVVEVTLRREIRFAYKVAIFANDRLQETFDGQQGNISHNYTLTNAVQGNISAQIEVGIHRGQMSEIQAVPQRDGNSDEMPTGGNVDNVEDDEENEPTLIAIVASLAFIVVALIVCVTIVVIIIIKRKRASKSRDTECNQHPQPKSLNFDSQTQPPRFNLITPTPGTNRPVDGCHPDHVMRRASDVSHVSSASPCHSRKSSRDESVGYGSLCSGHCHHCSCQTCNCHHHSHMQCHVMHNSCCDHTVDACHAHQAAVAPSNETLTSSRQASALKTPIVSMRRNSSDPNISRHNQQSSRVLLDQMSNRTISSSSAL